MIEKPWGSEEILESNDHYMVKRLVMRPGHRCSLQSHEHKLETIYVVYGVMMYWANGDSFLKMAGDSFTVEVGVKHRMQNASHEIDLVYLECSTPDPEGKDVKRYADDYQRSTEE